jgi:hypothetical protein
MGCGGDGRDAACGAGDGGGCGVRIGVLALWSIIAFAGTAYAGYKVFPPLEGWFCSGWIFESCTIKRIDALSESEDGQKFEFADHFDSVDEYNPTLQRCWLKNSSGYRAFEKSTDGAWNHLGVPRDVTFKCENQ